MFNKLLCTVYTVVVLLPADCVCTLSDSSTALMANQMYHDAVFSEC